MNDQTFAVGDIIVSKVHPKLGEFLSRDHASRNEMAHMRYLDGTIVRLPVRMVRHATDDEVAEYKRRKEQLNRT